MAVTTVLPGGQQSLITQGDPQTDSTAADQLSSAIDDESGASKTSSFPGVSNVTYGNDASLTGNGQTPAVAATADLIGSTGNSGTQSGVVQPPATYQPNGVTGMITSTQASNLANQQATGTKLSTADAAALITYQKAAGIYNSTETNAMNQAGVSGELTAATPLASAYNPPSTQDQIAALQNDISGNQTALAQAQQAAALRGRNDTTGVALSQSPGQGGVTTTATQGILTEAQKQGNNIAATDPVVQQYQQILSDNQAKLNNVLQQQADNGVTGAQQKLDQLQQQQAQRQQNDNTVLQTLVTSGVLGNMSQSQLNDFMKVYSALDPNVVNALATQVRQQQTDVKTKAANDAFTTDLTNGVLGTMTQQQAESTYNPTGDAAMKARIDAAYTVSQTNNTNAQTQTAIKNFNSGIDIMKQSIALGTPLTPAMITSLAATTGLTEDYIKGLNSQAQLINIQNKTDSQTKQIALQQLQTDFNNQLQFGSKAAGDAYDAYTKIQAAYDSGKIDLDTYTAMINASGIQNMKSPAYAAQVDKANQQIALTQSTINKNNAAAAKDNGTTGASAPVTATIRASGDTATITAQQDGSFNVSTPTGANGGTCGEFLGDLAGQPGLIPDLWTDKAALVQTKEPQAGMGFAMPITGSAYGHAGYVSRVNSDGSIDVVDSNYNADPKTGIGDNLVEHHTFSADQVKAMTDNGGGFFTLPNQPQYQNNTNIVPTYKEYGLLANTDFNPGNQTDKDAWNYLSNYLNSKTGVEPSAASLGISTRQVNGQTNTRFSDAKIRANDLYTAATGESLPNLSDLNNQNSLINANNKILNNQSISSGALKANFDLAINSQLTDDVNNNATIINKILNPVYLAFGDPATNQALVSNGTISQEFANLMSIRNSGGTLAADKEMASQLIQFGTSVDAQKAVAQRLEAEATNIQTALQDQNAKLEAQVDPLELHNNPNRAITLTHSASGKSASDILHEGGATPVGVMQTSLGLSTPPVIAGQS